MISVRLPYAFGGRSGYDELRSPSNAAWFDFLVERLTPKIALACLIVWILSPPAIVSAGTLSRINALTLDDVAAVRASSVEDGVANVRVRAGAVDRDLEREAREALSGTGFGRGGLERPASSP